MSSRVSTPALIAHHLRSRAGGGAIVAVLVFVLAALAMAVPVALGGLGDATLRDRLDAVPPTVRDVVSENTGSSAFPQLGASWNDDPGTSDDTGASDDPGASDDTGASEIWTDFAGAVDGIRQGTDAPLPDVLGPARAVTRSLENPIWEGDGTRAATIAFDPDYAEEIRLVDGRMPQPAAGSITDGADAVRVEVVLSSVTAAELGWSTGEVRSVGDPRRRPVELRLVGLFEAADPQSAYWGHVTSVLTPFIFDDGNSPRRVTGTAYAHPESLPAIAELPGQASTLVWYPTDIDRIDAHNAAATIAALNRLTAVSHPIGTSAQGPGLLGLRFDADVTTAIESAVAQQRSTTGVLAMLAAGPIGVAAAVLALGCRLILEGRRSSLRLLSARGATVGQLRGLLAAEGALAGTVPAVVGAALIAGLGILAFGGSPSRMIAADISGAVTALVIGLAPIVILFVLAPAASERPARADLGRRTSPRRLFLDVGVAVLAAVALVLLFVRGYSDGADLLLAATPLLLALVACVVTIRLYPLPLARAHARARAGANIDAFVGSARALREPTLGVTPVLALVVGVSVAVSSGVLLSTLQVGIAEASRAQVGADLRVQGAMFSQAEVDGIRQIEGVADASGISGAISATLDIDGKRRGTSVFIVDAASLRDVQGDGPGMLPAGVSIAPAAGSPPMIVVSGVVGDLLGDTAEVGLEGLRMEVAGVTRGPAPIGGRENWVAIDASYAAEVLGRDQSDRTILVRLDDDVQADADAAAAVEQRLRGILGPTVRIDTASRVAAATETSPALQGVRTALLLTTVVAALLSALAVVMTLTLAAGPRARVLALLRTLGAPRRSATALALWEIGPPAAAAAVAGTAFGALIPLVVMTAVDLRPFTGSTVAPAYATDPTLLLLTVGGFLAVTLVLTVATLMLSRRSRAAAALRTVEEG